MKSIIEMAKQAGFGIDESPCVLQPYVIQPLHGTIDDELTRFAALVLEEAAIALRNHGTYLDASEAAEIVEAIRDRKEKT
jgi:hypothetical protein